MNRHPRPFLVVCHEATRTGGSRVLVDLLEASRADLPRPIAVRLLAGGPLAGRLEAVADVEDHGQRPLAVLVNSALAAGGLAGTGDAPVVVYVHEEADALAGLPEVAVTALISDVVRAVLCVSEASMRALVDLGVDPSRIRLLPPLVPRPEPPGVASEAAVRAAVNAERARLVVGCGEASWRKGADLFVEVARRLRCTDDVRFCWVGRRPRGYARQLDHDLLRLDERDLVHWTGEVADTRPYLAAADVLLMTSREDPRPLAPLEAAHLGTPTLAFDVGGLGDLGRRGAASTVAYPDTATLASRLVELLGDPTTGSSLVASARELAATQLPDVIVPAFLDAVRSVVLDVPTSGPDPL